MTSTWILWWSYSPWHTRQIRVPRFRQLKWLCFAKSCGQLSGICSLLMMVTESLTLLSLRHGVRVNSSWIWTDLCLLWPTEYDKNDTMPIRTQLLKGLAAPASFPHYMSHHVWSLTSKRQSCHAILKYQCYYIKYQFPIKLYTFRALLIFIILQKNEKLPGSRNLKLFIDTSPLSRKLPCTQIIWSIR